MKNFLKIFIFAFVILTFTTNFALCENQQNVFQVGVSMTERIPAAFFGTWRVSSVIINTDSPANFKKSNLDIWNLSKSGDVINLTNPFSGASASITLNYVGNGTIKFTKKSDYDGKILTDIVELTLSGDKFSGINTIILETLSDVDNSVIKTAKATYNLNGDKIAGMSIK